MWKMVNGEINGDCYRNCKRKVFEIASEEIGNQKRSAKAQLLVDQIFGEELESAASSMECSMCGDLGFPEYLLHCSCCHEHREHSYCSTSYRELGSNEASWVCDWCWPSLKRNSSQSESDRRAVVKFDKESRRKLTGSSTGSVPRIQNGLDLLLEVAWATEDIQDLPGSPLAKCIDKDSGRRTVEVAGNSKVEAAGSPKVEAAGSPKVGSPKVESSSTKPSTSGKRRQGLGPDRWSVTQKRACSRNYGTICARTGIQLERSNLAKGFGRRYRLLSSMLC